MDFFLSGTSLLFRAWERQPEGWGKNMFMPFLKSSLPRAWRQAVTGSDMPTQSLCFGLSTTSSPASAIFNGPIQWRSDFFQPWNLEQLPWTLEKRGGGDCTSRKERGSCSLPSPCWGILTPWDACHAKWAPDPASTLWFISVSGSAESIIYFPCRLKSWVCLSGDFVPK